MYDPEQIDALIAERDRLRGEVEWAVTKLEEWEALVGVPLVEALTAATARALADEPYALAEVLEEQRGAFHKIAEDRNMWRARAKRAQTPRHLGSVRCTVYDCRIPGHWVNGVLP